MKILTTLLCAAFAVIPCVGSTLSDWQELHDKAQKGDAKAVLHLIEELDKRLAEDKDDQVAKAYLGSAWTLRSRDLGIGSEKLDALKKGGRLMDEAVTAAPDDARVRLVRAANALQLPAIFNRRKVAHADFAALTTPPLSDAVGLLTSEEQQAVWWFAAESFRMQKKPKETRAALEKALAADPDGPLNVQVRKALDK